MSPIECGNPEWMSGYIKICEQQWECCLVDKKSGGEIIFTLLFSQLYKRPSATSYSDKSGTEGAAGGLECIFHSQFRVGCDTSMGKQITRIRLLQRPGPVKDRSRRSRQRWELYVYVHTLTVMTHTHKLRWCVNSIQLRCGFVWLVLSATKMVDPVHVAGGCSVCVQGGHVGYNIGIACWGTYRAGSDFISPAWCASLTLSQSRQSHSVSICVCVCVFISSSLSLWVQPEFNQGCLCFIKSTNVSQLQTNIIRKLVSPQNVRTDCSFEELAEPCHRKS